MLEKPIITLTTDFGLKDPFIGIIKGILFGINPKAKIIDISHGITPHNIFEASQVISMSYRYFPPATIHIVVVDPQVGGPRRPLLVVTEDHYFIGPDNGVFSCIYEEHSSSSFFKVIHLTASHHFLPHEGNTFHGRDIFAPVAGWLSKGLNVNKFGEKINDYVTLSMPKPIAYGETAIEGEVIHIDNFGNAMTNITKDNLDKLNPGFSEKKFMITYKDRKLVLSNYYAEAVNSGLSSIINSFGLLELFIYKGRASEKFGIKTGDKISVKVM